jgi:uncharacterized membrane protein
MNKENAFQINDRRIHLIDYIRCILYLAIASFHFVSIVWIDHGYYFSDTSVFWWGTEQYARTFVYAGQIILSLTFALMGFRKQSSAKLKRILIGSAVGAVLMAVADYPENNSFFIWDIYPLIFAGTAVLILAVKCGKKFVYALAVIGLILLHFSFWDYLPLENFSVEVRAALVGDCVRQFADWPLLPWIGLIWLSFGLGQLAFRYAQKLQQVHRNEWAVWAVILACGIYNFNSYRSTPTDVSWACFVFRRSPSEFLAILFLYLLLFRVALLSQVQLLFEGRRLSVFIQRLYFTRNFGLFYLAHYLLMAFSFQFFASYFANDALISFLVFIFLPVLTEIILRIVFSILSKNKV